MPKWTVVTIISIQALLAVPAFAEPASSTPIEAASSPQPETAIPAPDGAALSHAKLDKDLPQPLTTPSLGYVEGIFTDTGKMLVSPLHWETSDWLKAGLVAGVTGGFFLIDENIRDFAQSHKNAVANKVATVGNDLGNPAYTLPPVGAFYLYGYLTKDEKAQTTALLAVESLAISSMFTEIIKVTADRERPSTGAAPDQLHGPHLSLKNLSFSSGHTSSAFSIATVFAEQYKDNAYVPPVAYGLATLTGLSRIYGNEHWASDVFFGAAIGYFVGKAVVKLHATGTANKITVVPEVGSNYTGLSVQYKF